LQKICESLLLNIPRVAVDTLDLKVGEKMIVTMLPDGTLTLVKETDIDE